VRRLGGGVHNHVRLHLCQKSQDAGAVTDVDFVVDKPGQVRHQAFLVPAGITLRPEENLALIVVDPMNGKPVLCEIDADFGADQTGGTRNEELLEGIVGGLKRSQNQGERQAWEWI